MRGCSSVFKTATVTPGTTAVCRVDVVSADGKVVLQLPVHDGEVTADRTAAQMRNFSVEVSDPFRSLTPSGMQSLLAPFGAHLQLWRGVRLSSAQTLVALYNTQSSWTVKSSFGQMVGVVGDPVTGGLRLGP